MRALLIAVLCLSSYVGASTKAHASYINLNTIVLGVNLDPTLTLFQFPCTSGPAGMVSCDDSVSIEDSVCSNTLSYKNIATEVVDISCRLSDGKNVVIARAQGALTIDNTQDAFGFVNLTMNPKVFLKMISAGGTKVKYLLKFN